MSKCGNCCYGVMTGPNRMFCSVQNCFCEEVFDCEDYEPIAKPQTNADRIRAMTDEELAAKIEELCQYTFMQISVYAKPFGKAELLDWLKQEAQCTSE